MWAASHRTILAQPHELALYLQHLVEETKSKAAKEEACNVLLWVHLCAGLSAPLSHPLVKATLKGLQQELAKSMVKKELMTVEIIVKNATKGSGTLSDPKLVTACLTLLTDFLHFNLSTLRPSNFVKGVS